VVMGGKLIHLRPDLRDQHLGHPTVHARYGVEEFDLIGERGAFPRSISALTSAMVSSR
jgi:hypothetical protein